MSAIESLACILLLLVEELELRSFAEQIWRRCWPRILVAGHVLLVWCRKYGRCSGRHFRLASLLRDAGGGRRGRLWPVVDW